MSSVARTDESVKVLAFEKQAAARPNTGRLQLATHHRGANSRRRAETKERCRFVRGEVAIGWRGRDIAHGLKRLELRLGCETPRLLSCEFAGHHAQPGVDILTARLREASQ